MPRLRIPSRSVSGGWLQSTPRADTLYDCQNWPGDLMRQTLVVVLLSLLVPPPALARAHRTAGESSLALTHVTVIDVRGGPAEHDATVVVVGIHIARVGAYKSVRPPKGARI